MKLGCKVVAGFALVTLAGVAAAQAYPDRPIRVLVPVPAGGTPDVLARTVTPGMAELMGQPLVIDNRGGAGGRIAAELAARAAPDGYTLFLTSPGALTIVPHLSKDVPYDTLRDFVPVGLVSTGAFLLLTHPSVPVKSVKELIALAKAEPGKLNYSSAGKSGKLQPLGVAGPKRSPLLPGVPTIAEAGVPRFEAGSWLGLLVPARTPKPIIARLHEVMVKVVHTPDIRSKIEAQGADPVASSPGEFAAMLRQEYELHAKIVKLAGVKVD